MARPRFPDDHDPVIEIRPAVGRFDDFMAVMGHTSMEANGCWCMSYRDARLTSPDRSRYMKKECVTDPGPGVLVYVDDEVAGWCSIAPRDTYRRLLHSRTIPLAPDGAWVAVCFVVRAGYRKHGLMHHLLEGAVAHAKAHGATVVEGYPVDARGDRVDVISGYVGTRELFEAAGFEKAADTTAHSGGRDRVIMRRTLKA